MTDAEREAQIRKRMASWYDGFADAPIVQTRDDCRVLLRILDKVRAERDDFYESQAAEYKLARERLIALADECLAHEAEIARLTDTIASNERMIAWLDPPEGVPPGASAMERADWVITHRYVAGDNELNDP